MSDSKRPLRSAQWFGTADKNGFMYRSWMKNQGIPDHEFQGKPIIGICNTWSELTPCNAHFRKIAEHVKKGVDDKKSVEAITSSFNPPWYRDWTGVTATETPMLKDNVKHVHEELTGKIDHDRLGARLDRPEWRGGDDGIAGARPPRQPVISAR